MRARLSRNILGLRPRALPRLCAWLLLACAWACGELPRAPTAVCRDPGTGSCVACPGANYCVDSLTCLQIACAPDSITFRQLDITAQSDGASQSDAANQGDAASQGDSAPQSDAAGEPDNASDASSLAELADMGDTSPETSQPGSDSAGADASPADQASPSDTAQSGDAPPADAQPACSPSATQCKGNTVQVCVFGTWQDDKPCPANKPCQDGACGCSNPCPAFNLVECLPNIAATRTCQLGSDKCLSWGLAIACKPGETCSQGQCLAPSGCGGGCPNGETCQQNQCVATSGGGLSCAQILGCAGSCKDSACAQACKSKGSPAGKAAVEALVACNQNKCGNWCNPEGPNCGPCMDQYCAAEQNACQ